MKRFSIELLSVQRNEELIEKEMSLKDGIKKNLRKGTEKVIKNRLKKHEEEQKKNCKKKKGYK